MNNKIMVLCSIFLLLTGCVTIQERKLIEKAKEVGIPICVTSCYSTVPNYAGGVDVWIKYVNTSNKTFKYVIFEVIPYNRVHCKG